MSIELDEENFPSGVGSRLEEERKRLKMTQEQLGNLCGVSKRTIVSWEEKAKIPSQKLAMLIPAGFDAWYVLTGTRSTSDSNRTRAIPVVRFESDKIEETIQESNSCIESHVLNEDRAKCSIRIERKALDFLAELAELTPEQQAQVLEFIRDKRRLNDLETQVSALAARR